MIKGLEDELGQVLFERKKSGVLLTREGAKLYNIAQKTKKNLVFCAEINTFWSFI